MPHARASALWRLGFASHSSLKADRSAPRNGFYGAREPQNETLAVECQLLGIPTPQNIVQFHDLKSLKAMCEAHKAATSGLASVSPTSTVSHLRKRECLPSPALS